MRYRSEEVLQAVTCFFLLAPDGAQRDHERHCLERIALDRLVQPRHHRRVRLSATLE